ncbi:MAG TPA: 50S ribosomal protein L9 [Candidatus Sumerlaeota bacterium]|nr:50S ribosomal protein L9 [Candidatus Sumerlaeota bacterium]HPS01546.1 50S ribosomal protein L9 [Candidatus Sumerlaeota bacterium]
MEVILFETVPSLGTQGTVVSVAPGYFRNFLSPRGFAVEATAANKSRLQDKVKRLERLAMEEKQAASSDAAKMEALTLTFQLKAGEDDKLFGSVTSMNVAEALAQKGFEVDRHRIVFPEAIKRLGQFTIEVKLHHDVVAKVKVLVEKEPEEA